MSTHARRGTRLALLGLALPLIPFLGLGGTSATAQPAATHDLLAPAPAGAATRVKAPASAERTRLGRLGLDLESLEVGDPVTLNLFADTDLEATVVTAARRDSYDAWYGTVEGGGTFDLVRIGRTTRLGAVLPSGTFEVVDDGRVATISETAVTESTREDSVPVPAEATRPAQAATHATEAATVSPALAGGAGDAPGQIDMLVAYTPQTLAARGTVASIQALAAASVEQTNRAFTNSQIASQVRLVGVVATATAESGAGHSSILNAVARPGDGRFDDLLALRAQYKADQVTTLITASEYCGLGFLDAPAVYAFTTVMHECAYDVKAFAHEFGHNLGAGHDAGATSPPGGAPDARGYVYVPGKWRTIMAYPDVCPTCPRIDHFSNPGVAYNGVPTGTVNDNNARVMNANLAKAANWTASQIYAPEIALTGSAVVGGIVGLTTGPWAPYTTVPSYSWSLDGVPLGVTSPTIQVTPAMAGRTLSLTVAGAAPGYTSVSVAGPSVVVAPGNIGLSAVRVNGTPWVGRKLSTQVSVGFSVTGVSYRYQWYRNGKKIKGKKATKAKYRLVRKDRRKKIHVVVTASAPGFVTASTTSKKIRVRR